MEIIDYKFKKIDNLKLIEKIGLKAKSTAIETEPWETNDQVFCQVDSGNIVKFCKILNEDEELGFEYVGPIDGHKIDMLIETIDRFKDFPEPVPVATTTLLPACSLRIASTWCRYGLIGGETGFLRSTRANLSTPGCITPSLTNSSKLSPCLKGRAIWM